MFFPRFSTRRLFFITAGFGIFFAVTSAAVRGHQWAGALSIALVGLLFLFAIFNLLFLVASAFASVRPVKSKPEGPFATMRPPPQLVRPEKPED